MTAVVEKEQPLWFLANLATVKVDGDETGGAWSLVEIVGAQGDMPPLHSHASEEAFYVLEGRLTLFLPGEEIVVEAGGCVVAPRDVPHVYRVDSEVARWLAIASPSGFERFVMDVAEPAAEPTLPPLPPSVDPARVAELAAGYGIQILGPPGALPA